HLLEHVHASDYVFNHTLELHMGVANRFLQIHRTHNHSFSFSEGSTVKKCCSCQGGETLSDHTSHRHIARGRGSALSSDEDSAPKNAEDEDSARLKRSVDTRESPKGQCFSPLQMLAAVKLSIKDNIDVEAFKDLCPIILDQIDLGTCLVPLPQSEISSEEEP